MRHVRLTWPGAFHHVMNRGHNGMKIFTPDSYKGEYLKILGDEAEKKKIQIFGYCIMDSHFHIILENSSGRLSDFMKMAHTRYGIFYRRMEGGRGYVFHDRFKSTLIQDDSYLMTAILYFLNNPVRAGVVSSPFDYKWSSASLYFQNAGHSFVNVEFVESLFPNQKEFIKNLKYTIQKDSFQERHSRFGRVFGEKSFIEKAEKKFDRRKDPSKYLNKREEDLHFDPIDKIIQEFESKIGKSIEEIDRASFEGKRQRGELMLRLRDIGGLKYSEIYEFDIFKDLRFSSLGRLYQQARDRREGEN